MTDGMRGDNSRNSVTTRNSARLMTNSSSNVNEAEEERSEFSETESEEESYEENNKENEDTHGSTNSLRRSTRRRNMRYDTFNQSWIFGGDGPKGYPQEVIKQREQEKPTRRSGRLSSIKTEVVTTFEESDDMYSRVKRLRRKPPRLNYHQPTPPVEKMRLRERPKPVKKQEFSPSLSEYLRRPKRFKKRRRVVASSDSSSSDEESYQVKKRPNANAIGMDKNSFKAQQRQFLSDLQPIKVDPSVTFDSIGGLQDHINKLKEVTVFPLIYKEFYVQRNITPPRGILFHGLPGTGKTLMARALANECLHVGGKKVSFFLRKGADILNRWVGESERQLKVLFEQAAAHQPSIIFFDEIDGLAPVRSSKSDQVHNSVVSTLLAELDGVNDRGDIIVIGATNRIDSIDPALRRPGRFDFEMPFFLPGKEARKEILTVQLKKTEKSMVEKELLDELAEKTSGFSGADLNLLCSEASMSALRRCYPQIYNSKQKLLVDYGTIQVTRADWMTSLKSVRPVQRQIQKPLPPQLLPLLGRHISGIEKKLNKIFPLTYDALLEPSLKRMLIHANNTDVIDEFIIPGVLHRLDCVKVFRLDLQEVSLLGGDEQAAISTLTSAPLNYKDPSILYIPRLDNLLKMLSEFSRNILRSKLISCATSPCMVIATSEDSHIEDFEAFFLVKDEIDQPTELERKEFFAGIFAQALIVKEEDELPAEELPLAPVEKIVCKEEDMRKIVKKENSTLRELRIFLREILAKLARDRSFVEFTKPVDLSEVPDYNQIIKNPMDFETMMAKIDAEQYMSAEMFLKDIKLIVDNALFYNPNLSETDRRLRHHAKQLWDRAEDLIDKEMDSDFEEICKGIIKCRQERERPAEQLEVIEPKQEKDEPLRTPSSQKKRRKRGWFRGSAKKSRKSLEMSVSPTKSSPTAEATITNWTSELQKLLENVTALSKRMSVFDMLEVRYQLCVAVEKHQKSHCKLLLILELQDIVNSISF